LYIFSAAYLPVSV